MTTKTITIYKRLTIIFYVVGVSVIFSPDPDEIPLFVFEIGINGFYFQARKISKDFQRLVDNQPKQ